jgi:hypothetical protein
MSLKSIAVVALVLVIQELAGCCIRQHRDEPLYPTNVSGWKTRNDRGVTALGDFVLKKNETIDNGKVQVKILDLVAPDACAEAGAFQRNARARIQFVSLTNQKVMCDDLFAENGTGTLSALGGCPSFSESGISVVYVSDINLKEGWVFFELRK